MVALVVSGVLQAVREVGSPTALAGTAYGRLLLVVALVLASAGVSRVWVQQRLGIRRPRRRRTVTAHAFAAPAPVDRSDPAPNALAADRVRVQAGNAAEHLPSLRRSLLVEAALAAVVLALSAVLVATPAGARGAGCTRRRRAAPAGRLRCRLRQRAAVGRAGPARRQRADLYLFDDAGRLTQPVEIRVTLAERGQEIGPLDVDLEPAGPDHYVGDGMTVRGAGTWTLTVDVRLDEFTALTAATDFPVR